MRKAKRSANGTRILVFSSTSMFPTNLRLAGVYRFAGEANDRFVIPVLPPSNTEELDKLIRLHGPDGVIAFGKTPDMIFERLAAIGIPAVYHSTVRKTREQYLVFCDHLTIGREAARCLHARGIRQFAYVGVKPLTTGDKPHSEAKGSELRERGFIEELGRLGGCRFPVAHFDLDADNPFNEIRALGDWLAALPNPCGVLTYCDMLAEPVVHACHEMKIDVPGRLSVLGIDNEMTRCENAPIPISSIEPDFEGCGYLAASLLDRILSGHAPAEHLHSYAVRRIVERASTLNVAGLHGRTRSVDRLIRAQALSGITVKEIAARLGLSVRTLEIDYRRATGKSVRTALTEIRLKEVTRLLATRHSLAEIAKLSGFPSQRAMAALFLRHHGRSLTEYRKRV